NGSAGSVSSNGGHAAGSSAAAGCGASTSEIHNGSKGKGTDMKFYCAVSALALFAIAGTNHSSAQIILGGTNYTQTFETIGVGLPPGWSVRTNASASALGTTVAFTTNSTSWNNTTAQFANFASTRNGTNLNGGESTAMQAACPD